MGQKRDMSKILLFGLAGDPVHNGHLLAAREIKETLGFPEVIFVPSGDHALKTLTPFHYRAEMVRIAIKNEPGFDISLVEGQRQGKSFTVDTVAEFRACGFKEVYWCVGTDNIEQIPLWHDYERLTQICKFVAVSRHQYPIEKSSKRGHDRGIADIQLVEIPALPISSTQIRARIKKNQSIRYLVPDGVADYIKANNLYRD